MSSEEQDELEQLLHPLRNPVALSGPEDVEAQRERLLPGLRAHVQRAPTRARRVRIARRIGQVCAAGVAAAACFALGRGLFTPPALPFAKRAAVAELESLRVEPLGPSAEVTFIEADGSERALFGPASLRETGELVSGTDNEARVSTQDGVQVELAPSTRVRVTAREPGRARPPVHLVSGKISCRVPPLGRNDSFSIMTPTAQVIVHGTVFSVRVDGGNDAKTCVQVERGLVRYATATARPTSAPIRSGAASPRRRRSTWERRPKRTGRRAIGACGRSGRAAPWRSRSSCCRPRSRRSRSRIATRARQLFAELLGKYPNSPLVPEARAGLTRSR